MIKIVFIFVLLNFSNLVQSYICQILNNGRLIHGWNVDDCSRCAKTFSAMETLMKDSIESIGRVYNNSYNCLEYIPAPNTPNASSSASTPAIASLEEVLSSRSPDTESERKS